MPDKNWFQENMHAVYSDSPFSACSFCSLRNLKKFCNLLIPACSYHSQDWSITGAVTWMPNDYGMARELEMGLPPREMVLWFNITDSGDIKKTAQQMARNAIIASRKSR